MSSAFTPTSTTFYLLTAVELKAGLAALILAGMAWRQRRKPAAIPLVVMALGGAGWAFATAIESMVGHLGWSVALRSINHLFADVVAIGVLYLAAEYAGRRWFHSRRVVALFIVYVLFNALVMVTNPVHELFYLPGTHLSPEGYLNHLEGPFFWMRILVDFVFVLVGLAILAMEMRTRLGTYRLQAATLAFGVAVGFGAVVLEVFDLFTTQGFDFSTVGITVSCAILLWALFYADLLEVAPVARKTLMESMDDAVLAVDREGRLIDANPVARELFGLEPADLGRVTDSVLEDYPALIDAFDGAESSTSVTLERDGERRHYDLERSAIRPTDGILIGRFAPEDHAVGALLVVRDITDQQRKQDQLERANRQLDQFASVVSHDLRNPLGIAQTYLDFARDSGDEADFDAVADALERMDDMVDDLLTFARAGGAITHVEPLDVERLVADAWDNVETPDASLELEMTGTVSGNREYLLNVFENLFRNAREHNSDTLLVRVHGTTDDGAVQKIVVEDDGTGIEREDHEAVFDHGFSRSPEGSGFGLAIVQAIVEAHNWSITVGPGRDGGARFEITTEERVTDELGRPG